MTEPLENGLFEETRLRRALRLDVSELPPRLDADALAAVAARHASGARLAFAVIVAAGALSVAGILIFAAVAPVIAPEILGDLIGLAASALVTYESAARLVQQPSVALAALATILIYELARRKERLDAAAAAS